MRDNILDTLIYPAVEEIRPTVKDQVQFTKSPDTVLYGSEGSLDSLGLVNFIVVVEELLSSSTGKDIRLVSEKAMSRKYSPFRTLSTLAEYIEELINDYDKENA